MVFLWMHRQIEWISAFRVYKIYAFNVENHISRLISYLCIYWFVLTASFNMSFSKTTLIQIIRFTSISTSPPQAHAHIWIQIIWAKWRWAHATHAGGVRLSTFIFKITDDSSLITAASRPLSDEIIFEFHSRLRSLFPVCLLWRLIHGAILFYYLGFYRRRLTLLTYIMPTLHHHFWFFCTAYALLSAPWPLIDGIVASGLQCASFSEYRLVRKVSKHIVSSMHHVTSVTSLNTWLPLLAISSQ
jgi:hypothetical protein